MVSIEEVKERILERIECIHLEVEDTSCGCGSSFKALVVSGIFDGMGLLQRHKSVLGIFS